jgi:DOPA 4,5-dioxygenase
VTIREFHAHVYYTAETRASAGALRETLLGMAGGRLKLYTLSDGPRGPHVTPMFGVDIPAADLPETLGFLMQRHGPHAVLIHPVTGNELLDHTHHALWLGHPQPLDLAKLA